MNGGRDEVDDPWDEHVELIGSSVRATETLLVRARAAFRRAYEESEGDGA